jgi:hypothetical protein
VWLVALGLVRRLLFESSEGADVLLLIGPAAIAVLAVTATSAGAFRARSSLANAVLVMMVLIFLGAINPAQGSASAGVAGLLFLLVPMLAFWIGRSSIVDTQLFRRVLSLAVVFGLAVAFYGLFQSLVGFPSWDVRWADSAKGYSSLYIEGTVLRPFASMSSAADYSYFVAIALVVSLSALLVRNRRLVSMLTAPPLAVALLYASVRTVLVTTSTALAAAIAARARLSVAKSGTFVVASVVLISFVASAFATSAPAAGTPGVLLAHQVSGLADPLNPQTSTLLVHLTIVRDGLLSAIDNPLGRGISVVTLAGSRLGTSTMNTESDPSNLAVALGVPGLLAYVVLVCLALAVSFRLARQRCDWPSISALAILLATLFQWFNGGHYAVTWLIWLTLGWVDRTVREPPKLT